MARRKSRRFYTEEVLNLEELSFLLWATQGLRKQRAAVNNFMLTRKFMCYYCHGL